ncbi:MAG: hypothetical protein JSS02_08475 [Planctomycetes bacterium]|nr:hypothetical protein [Planctomycetota bacterium]
MSDAIALFAIRLICGMAFMLCVMPRRDVATAYFRILLLVTLGLAVLFSMSYPPGLWPGIAVAVVSFVGSVLWLLERRRGGALAIALVFGIALVELLRMAPREGRAEGPGGLWLTELSALAAAGTLGAAMTGMLLGHRYLTAPGMPLAPLYRLNYALGAAGLVRLVASGIALALGYRAVTDPTYQSWLALRWFAGIGGPLVACLMVHRILRYRNTQSATGVLFVAVILTFIGELTADLLLRAVKIPF